MLPATCSSSQPLLHGSIFSMLVENLYSVLRTLKRLAAHRLRNIAVYISFLEINAFNRDFSLNSYLNFFWKQIFSSRRRSLFSRNFNLKDFFSCGKQFFEDQSRRPGIRTVPQNPYAGRKMSRRGPNLAHRSPVWHPWFRSYVARYLHFVANDKKGLSLPPFLFLGWSPSVLLVVGYIFTFVDFIFRWIVLHILMDNATDPCYRVSRIRKFAS